MAKAAKIHWVRTIATGILAELAVFAIVFPVLHFFGQRAFLASILIASALMPFLFAIWLCHRVESQFVLHGALEMPRHDQGDDKERPGCGALLYGPGIGFGADPTTPLQDCPRFKSRWRCLWRTCGCEPEAT